MMAAEKSSPKRSADVRIVPMTSTDLAWVAKVERESFDDPWTRSLFESELEDRQQNYPRIALHHGEPDAQAYVVIGADPGYSGSLTRHVFETLAFHAHLALHVRVLAGRDPHHLVETQFKAFARAFRDAVAIDPRETGVPSTKGSL